MKSPGIAVETVMTALRGSRREWLFNALAVLVLLALGIV
jgi:hypothetical protein